MTNPKKCTIPLFPALKSGKQRELRFEKEYQFSGILSNIVWNGQERDHPLSEKEIIWLGSQNAGADFKGVDESGSLIGCEVKLGFGDLEKQFAQALRGAQQALSFLQATGFKLAPGKCALFVIAPESYKAKPPKLSISKIQSHALNYETYKKNRDKAQLVRDICKWDMELSLACVEATVKEDFITIRSNLVKVGY